MEMLNQVMRFAEKHFKNYKIANGQVIPEYCCFCNGGENHDKYTFAIGLNNGAWQCLRGSCGEKGNFAQLCDHFGEQAPEMLGLPNISSKKYKLPEVELDMPSDEIEKYFALRRISKATMEAFGIRAKDGNIAFPFRREANGSIVYLKYRKPKAHLTKEDGPKEWCEAGCEPILYNCDQVTFNKPLVITEGLIDAMAVYEAGWSNVVSVPSGCKQLDWIENQWEWLENFNQIIMFGDNDEPGKEMINICTKRLGEARCMLPADYPVMIIDKEDGTKKVLDRLCKDANEILYAYGPSVLLDMIKACKPAPIKGVINMASIPFVDPTTVPRIFTRIPSLDDMIAGLGEGSLTVVTGKRAEG